MTHHPHHNTVRHINSMNKAALCMVACMLLLASCARMGQPDGGWYDELPPKIVGTNPREGAVNVNNKRIILQFDEYIKLENAQEKVVISPAQRELPNIKVQGRRIIIDLIDSLQPNTTYTIDFSDAIVDLNEGNPMGNYTYTFSTGNSIDSLQMSGNVVDAYTLEPIKGIMVGVYLNEETRERREENGENGVEDDTRQPKNPVLQRVARTDAGGRFVIKGMAKGNYKVMAINDVDGDFAYSQAAEQIAFNDETYTPTFSNANRQDTIWKDSLHIRDIRRTSYIRYQPDDIVLRAFTAVPNVRAFVKFDRQQSECFTLFFSAPDTQLPALRGLNFDSSALITEAKENNDTITYWLTDSILIRQDTLSVELSYRATDTLGVLQTQVDTLDIVSRRPFAQRQKDQQKEYERWQQQQKKRQQRGEPVEQLMASQMLQPKYAFFPLMSPENNVHITMPVPLARIDTAAIHLFVQQDSTWRRVDRRLIDKGERNYEIRAAWQPEKTYSLEIDSTAFTDIYGRVSPSFKTGLKVKSEDEYGSLFISFDGWEDKPVIAQLLNQQEAIIKEVVVKNGVAAFFYLSTGSYFLRAFIDDNNNGRWDTGDYESRRQPELMCYYPRAIACRAKWDIRERWNPTAVAANKQKPSEIRKQVDETKKSTKQRNFDRARKLGIKEIPDKVMGITKEE